MPIPFEDQLKIAAGSPGNGKVLVSDSNGVGSWETLDSLQTSVRTGNASLISGVLTQNQFTTVPTITGTLSGFPTHVNGVGYNTTNGRIDPAQEGFYEITLSISVSLGATAGRVVLALFNQAGTEIRRVAEVPGSANSIVTITGSAIVWLNGTTDYVYPRIYTTSNTATFYASSSSSVYVELLDPALVSGGGIVNAAGGVLSGAYPNPDFSTASKRRLGMNELGERIYYPEDYGAVGDGTTDDTAAIQQCIDLITFFGGGIVQFSGVTYRVSGALQNDHEGNSILQFPDQSNFFPFVIRLRGVPGKTKIQCVGTGYTYNATYGPPSVIGGPTRERKGNAALSGCEVIIEDLDVIVPANPKICGIDIGRSQRATVRNVSVSSADALTQPTAIYNFGIRMPGGLNYGDAILDNTHTYGVYAGVVIHTAHTTIISHVSKWCVVGVALTDTFGDRRHHTPC